MNNLKKTPFRGKSLHSATIFAMLNGGTLKSHKLLAELTHVKSATYVKSATKMK